MTKAQAKAEKLNKAQASVLANASWKLGELAENCPMGDEELLRVSGGTQGGAVKALEVCREQIAKMSDVVYRAQIALIKTRGWYA